MKLDRVIAVRNRKTVFRDGDRCVKVFNEDYTKADVLNEALNQARIEQTGLNIPEILEISQFDGKWSIVSRYIEGKTLQQLCAEQPENRKKYMEMFVSLHCEIHTKCCPLLSRQNDRMNMDIVRSDLDATTRFDLHRRLDSMTRQNQICHGDFGLSNIILSKDGVPYILDWSRATQGNAAADAARTYLIFWLEGNIQGAAQYLEMYCAQSGTPRETVDKWMPIVAAAQSVLGNSKQREFLLSWVNEVNHDKGVIVL